MQKGKLLTSIDLKLIFKNLSLIKDVAVITAVNFAKIIFDSFNYKRKNLLVMVPK